MHTCIQCLETFEYSLRLHVMFLVVSVIEIVGTVGVLSGSLGGDLKVSICSHCYKLGALHLP